jgi:hypothetical protein
VTPSGIAGGFVNATQLSWQASYALTERARIGAQASLRKSQSATRFIDSVNYKTLGANFVYNVAPRWDLAFSVTRRQVDYSRGSANGNIVGLTLTYNHPDL